MTTEWDVQKALGQCGVTGRTIEPDEEFYSVLLIDGESFRRVDYSLEAWTGPPENSFCHYKTRMPVRQKKKQMLVDNEALRAFFGRLAGEQEPLRVQFRFVLALILMRKRLLKFERSTNHGGVETWQMQFTGDKSVQHVVNPRMGDDEIQRVSQELNAILHTDMHEWIDAHADESVGEPADADGAERG